jgi:hypothetical protein
LPNSILLAQGLELSDEFKCKSDVRGLQRQGRLEGFGCTRMIGFGAPQMTALDQSAKMSHIPSKNVLDKGFGLIKPAQDAQVACPFQSNAMLMWRKARGQLKGARRRGVIATLSPELPTLDQRADIVGLPRQHPVD